MKAIEGRDITFHSGMTDYINRDVVDNTLDTVLLGYNISGLLVDIQDHPLLFGVKSKTIKLVINLEESQ
jgi:flagellar biogenesis protein FliO